MSYWDCSIIAYISKLLRRFCFELSYKENKLEIQNLRTLKIIYKLVLLKNLEGFSPVVPNSILQILRYISY